MIVVSLEVTKPSSEEDRDAPVEDWGAIGLQSVPSRQDILHLWRDRDFHILRVVDVVHRAVEWPLPTGGAYSLGRKEPSVLVLADYVSIDIRYA
jgi:hypothetical protein